MKKMIILAENNIFLEDLAQQIKIADPSIEVLFAEDNEQGIILVDEDEGLLKDISLRYKTSPKIFFSSTKETSKYADVVIKKPFLLSKFLKNLTEGTLLPKVRHKECINFNEYSLYPVKKEIISSTNGKIVKLTEKEVTILKYLYNKSPETISKEELLENVWGYNIEMATHTIETHIYRLRQKVEKDGSAQIIITENNGYRLNI